jgi:hypothetical protein
MTAKAARVDRNTRCGNCGHQRHYHRLAVELKDRRWAECYIAGCNCGEYEPLMTWHAPEPAS